MAWQDETGRSARDAEAPPAAPRILLFEPHPDHAEVVREALERAWPDADVRTRPQQAGAFAAEHFDLLVCSTAAIDDARNWLSRVDGAAPPVVLIADAEHPARPMQGARVAAILDKRNARGFVDRLAGAAVSALLAREPGPVEPGSAASGPATQPAVPDAPGAPDALPATAEPAREETPGSGMLTPRTYDGGALHEPPPERDRRADALAAGIAQALSDFLDHAAPLAELAARRAARDPVLTAYLGGFSAELGRARGLAARLARLLGEPPVPARRTMRAADLVTLRAGAWRGWLPDGITLRLATETASEVTVDPALIAPSLDDLVQALAPCADPPCGIDVGVTPVTLGAEFAATRPGARAGRFVRFALAAARGHVPRVDPEPGPVPVGEPALQAALAAAKAHGGYLELRWDPVRGRLEAADLYLPAGQRVAPEGKALPAAVSVLLVDDDASVRETVAALLAGVGWRPLTVPSGTAAVDLYRAGCRYDLVLLDLLMPELSGAETFRALRAFDPAVRVVVASGSRPGEPLRRMLAEGALGFVAKPFGLKELTAIVEAATGSRPPAPTRA